MLSQSSTDSGYESTYGPISYLIDYVRYYVDNEHVNFIWNMTWAYQSGYSSLSRYNNNQLTMYNAICSAVQNKVCTNTNFLNVMPIGTAIQNARTSKIGDNLNRDGTHLSIPLGRYIAGLTFLCTVTGDSPDDVNYAPTGLSAEQIAIAKESVSNALKDKFKVTQSTHI